MQVFQGKGSTNNRKGTNTDKSWDLGIFYSPIQSIEKIIKTKSQPRHKLSFIASFSFYFWVMWQTNSRRILAPYWTGEWRKMQFNIWVF